MYMEKGIGMLTIPVYMKVYNRNWRIIGFMRANLVDCLVL